MYDFIVDICEKIGPRASGTEQEILSGNKIEEELKMYCNEVHQEGYISSPHAFLGGIRFGAMLVSIAIIFYWITLLHDLNLIQLEAIHTIIFLMTSICLIIITICYFIFEVMKYHEIFDFLFPKKESKNIIGTINPSSEIKNTIIFSAHHDSAYEFNTFYYLKRFGQTIINIGYGAVVLVFFAIILKMIFFIFSIEFLILFLLFGIIFIAFMPIIVIYVFFHSYNPVLGACDNLSGVAIVLGIGKFLFENKNIQNFYPKRTKVLLISFAGEESGLRGAKRYVDAHLKELIESRTIVINMDSIAKKDKIIIHNKELGIGAKHDPEVFERLLKIATDLNIRAKLAPLPFGATDGAAFSKKTISAASISGLNLKEELAPYYHTREDKPAIVEKEALGQVLRICLEYLKFIDK